MGASGGGWGLRRGELDVVPNHPGLPVRNDAQSADALLSLDILGHLLERSAHPISESADDVF